jgi:hypothetical protein
MRTFPPVSRRIAIFQTDSILNVWGEKAVSRLTGENIQHIPTAVKDAQKSVYK